MADVFSTKKRSSVMAKIKGKGNKKTEIVLVSLLRSAKITGWRRHLPIFGKPDFCFPQQKLAIFVDGCFWHGCPIHYNIPANNAEFWAKKRVTNIARDRKVNQELHKRGWRVVRLWEHDLKRRPANVILRLKRMISDQSRRRS